jgi:putative PIN family toxin of toxin-antitoxin system
MYQVILDTNVLYSAIRSKAGASFRLLSMIPDSRFEINLSAPLVLEYEEILKRPDESILLEHQRIDDILDYLCRNANQRKVYYLWRPLLPDPDDDLLLELAVECNCDFLITFNIRDFFATKDFGIRVVTPGEFLRIIGASI